MNQKHSFREYSNYKVPRQFKKINNPIDIGSPLPLPYAVSNEDVKAENNSENRDENRNEDKFIKKHNGEIFDRKKIKLDITKLIKHLELEEKHELSEDMKLKDTSTSLDSDEEDKINTTSNKTKKKVLIEIGDPLPLKYKHIDNSSSSSNSNSNDLAKERVGLEIKSIRKNLLKSQSLNEAKTKVKRHQLDFGEPLPLEYIGQQTSSEGYRLKITRNEIKETGEDDNEDNNEDSDEGSNEYNNEKNNEKNSEKSDLQSGLQEIEKVESYNSNNQRTEHLSEELKEKYPITNIAYMDKLNSKVPRVLLLSFLLFTLLSVVSYYLAD